MGPGKRGDIDFRSCKALVHVHSVLAQHWGIIYHKLWLKSVGKKPSIIPALVRRNTGTHQNTGTHYGYWPWA